ncbi:MAG: glycosyltransferase [Peptococcaceae bacterium]|nr:glycosyltransferase [Peptococcaceae bacterium]
MNVGLFTDPYYPIVDGVSNSVGMLKAALEGLGHEVHVFTTTNPLVDHEEMNVHRSVSMPFLLLPSRRVGMPYNPKAVHLVRQLKLDVVHTHTEFTMGTFGMAMAKNLRKPLVHTYHTLYEDYSHYWTKGIKYFEKPSRKAVRALSRTYCNACDRVIVPTGKTRDLLNRYEVQTPIVTIPTGLPLERFKRENIDAGEVARLRSQYGIGSDDKVILFIGRIAKEKQLEDLFEVMPEFMMAHENVKFLLVGDGPWRSIIEEVVAAKDMTHRVVFAGEQPYASIGGFYQLGDVFINASQTETQGLTYLEAMAAGVPVLAREDKCLEGVIESGVSGVTFMTVQEVSGHLEKLLFDDDWRGLIRANAGEVVRAFSAHAFAQKVEAVYQDVLSDVRDGKIRKSVVEDEIEKEV